MSPKKLYSFKIDPDVAEALKRIKERDGVGESEQIRRGIEMWLKSREEKTERKRASPRKRS